MKRKRITFALCLLATIAVVVYLRSNAQDTTSTKPPAQAKQNNKLQPNSNIRPQDIYEQMFRHYAALQNQAQAAEHEGKDGSALRSFYRREAKLTDQQDSQLNAIASDCVNELERLDARAKQVIDEARARTPGGQLKKGEMPPDPPAELSDLQQQREAKVLQARDKLHTGFGDAEFARFDGFVQQTVAANMKSSAPSDHRLQQPPLPRSQSLHP